MSIEKTFNDIGNGCGCITLVVAFLIIWNCSGCGGKIDSFFAERRKAAQEEEVRANQVKSAEEQKARQAEDAVKKVAKDAENEVNLRKFAKEFVPDLQQAIDKYEEQIKQFTEQRIVFAQEMAKLKVDPETRPAFGRKKEIIDKMAGDVKQLLADRQETYIRWKELNLLHDTAGTKDQRDKLLQIAQQAARRAEATFDKYMKQSLDADGK